MVTALSLPAAALITLIGGAIFDLVESTILASLARTLGATLSFLMARTLLRDSVETRFTSTVESINKGVEKEGGFYRLGIHVTLLKVI